MFKIQHTYENNHFIIRYKNRTTTITPAFLCALLIALGIHLTALLIFTINSTSPSEIALSPSVQVETDPNIHFGPANLNTSKIDRLGFLTYSPEQPSSSRPRRPTLRQSPPEMHHTLSKEVTYVEIPVRQFEKSFYLLSEEQASPKKSTPSSLNVRFAGGLASRKIKESCLPKIQELLSQSTLPYSAALLYTAKLEEQTGKVFEFSKIAGSDDEEISALAETVLKTLRLEGQKENVLTEGMIELSFYTDELDGADPEIIFD